MSRSALFVALFLAPLQVSVGAGQVAADGDLVWSRDPDTGEEGLHRVTRTFVRSAPVMELEVIGDDATDVFVVTGEHPFWRRDHEGGGWVRAQDLSPGDEVFTSRGGWARIGSGTWLAREQLVYNFEVEGSHTYFVGETGTWVHNQCTMIGQASGPSIIVPEGAAGPSPANSGRGVLYTGGRGGHGLHRNVAGVRIMEPTAPSGPSPGYPSGYPSYSNAGGQAVDPYTGRTISRSDPMWHIPR